MNDFGGCRITLVVATYNGERTLPNLIDSINLLDKPRAVQFNVIFINNNSNDETSLILSEKKLRYPVTILFEEKQGKNAALNRIFKSDVDLGELLIFSDDDVVLPRDFIERYYLVIQQFPDIEIFGGCVEPLWIKQPPENLLLGIDIVVAFAITPKDREYLSGPIDPIKLHGPNMAIRSSVFSGSVRFNEDIGPNGKNYMMGSETELLYRLKKKGYSAHFDELNVVSHVIWPEQLESRWLKKRAYRAGRSLIMHQCETGVHIKSSEINGFPRWALYKRYKLMIKKVLRFYDGVYQYRALWESSHLKGYCDEYKKVSKGEADG